MDDRTRRPGGAILGNGKAVDEVLNGLRKRRVYAVRDIEKVNEGDTCGAGHGVNSPR